MSGNPRHCWNTLILCPLIVATEHFWLHFSLSNRSLEVFPFAFFFFVLLSRCTESFPFAFFFCSVSKVEELFSIQNNRTNVEVRLVNQHLYRAFEGTEFHILDISHLSEFRADAHPSTAGGKKHDDCMHWCLPGLTDIWNDLFVAYLNNLEHRT